MATLDAISPHPHLPCMRILIAAALLLTAAPAMAQTYVPGQSQANVNAFQLQMQANQIQQLQRTNAAAMATPDPTVRADALARQQQLNNEAAQNSALQQQALKPGAPDPSSLSAQLQASGVRLDQLQQQVPNQPR